MAYKELLLTYCRHDYVNNSDIADINPNPPDDSLLLVPLDSIYLGVSLSNHLAKPEIVASGMVRDFKLNCRKLIKLCCKIRQRFNFRDLVFSQIIALDPENALSCRYRNTVPTLVNLMRNMPRCLGQLSMQDIDDQWRRLPNCTESLPSNILNTVCSERSPRTQHFRVAPLRKFLKIAKLRPKIPYNISKVARCHQLPAGGFKIVISEKLDFLEPFLCFFLYKMV